jgi:hypothetical protein
MRDGHANELQSTPCVIRIAASRRLGLSSNSKPALSCATLMVIERGGDLFCDHPPLRHGE